MSELLADCQLYRKSDDYKALLAFVVRLRNFAPFNAMLLQVQKPGLRFAASAYEWATKFKRQVKEGARPLLILWPFAPVAFVYDVDDTEGDDQLPDDIAQAFRATGAVTKDEIVRYGPTLARRGIYVKLISYGDGAAGHIRVVRPSTNKKEMPDYQVRLNASHEPSVQFVSLVHELAHLFLGHLGNDAYLRVEGRRPRSAQQVEVEAECVAYLVCSRHGVKSKSESYLTQYLSANATVDDLDLYAIFTAAGQCETVLRIAPHQRFAA